MSLVVIEGLDGAGKSTQIGLLQEKLSTEKKDTESVHYPRTDNKWFGELISKFLRGEYGKLESVDPYLVAMLYAGDRHAMKQTLEEWISRGIIVLSDRYVYSNVVYQCAKLPEEERAHLANWIFELEFEHFQIPRPNVSIFLDVPFTFTQHKLKEERTGKTRDYLKGQKDIHEADLNFQQEVRNMYLEISKTDSGLILLDCADKEGKMKPSKEIHEEIIRILNTKKITI